MSLKRAVVIDPYSKGSYHEVINYSYLYLVAEIYEETRVVCDKTAFDCWTSALLKAGLILNNIKFKNIVSCESHLKYFEGVAFFWSHFLVALKDIWYYVFSKKGEDVFYNNNLILGLWFINLISYLKKNHIYIMCHSEINILEKKNKSKSEFILLVFLKLFLQNKISPHITYFVLGDSIRNKLLSHSNKNNEHQIKYLDHSYIREKIIRKNLHFENLNKGMFKIGIPSLINYNRGLNKLLTLIDLLDPISECEIYAIGRVIADYPVEKNKLIQLNKTQNILSSTEYLNYVEQMDAMIFFVDKNDFGASGGVLEAIWNEKIIFSLDNSYIRYLFNKFGELGVIFESTEKMSSYLNGSIEDLIKDKYRFLENIERAKSKLMPQNMIEDFKNLLK
jgi:hypothetical protein